LIVNLVKFSLVYYTENLLLCVLKDFNTFFYNLYGVLVISISEFYCPRVCGSTLSTI